MRESHQHLRTNATTEELQADFDYTTSREAMTSNSKASKPSRTGLTVDSSERPPAIAALFLIRFDIKAGYTISWKRSHPGVELENVVEFKSLPSGLHNVKDDLIYFVYEQYAGISAFINRPAAESERNALMLAVGVMVPLSHGRLGKNWRHAAGLKRLAQLIAENPDDTSPLNEYWERFELSGHESSSPPESPVDVISTQRPAQQAPPEGFRRTRALSDATALVTSKHVLAPFHPALSSPELIDTFGPLLFPLYRAALLRKRILLVGDAPVEMACNFVYNLSLLSSIPHTLTPLLPPTAHSLLRPRPLFNVCIHDMSYLLSLPRNSSSAESCWIACTTDRVLALKPELYDIVVNLAPPFSKNAAEKVYPTVTFSNPSPPGKKVQPITLKATQRDARRYLHLRGGLGDFARADVNSEYEDDADAESTFSSSSIVEPLSWPLLAYTSFIWWASAGEKNSDASDDEKELDARLLMTEEDTYPMFPPGSSRPSSAALQEGANTPQEVAIVTYFRRLTTQIFTVLSDAIGRHDGADLNADETETSTAFTLDHDEYDVEEEAEYDTAHLASSTAEDLNEALLPSPARCETYDNGKPVPITTADITEMGLDPWSEADRAFAEALCKLWFERTAQVQGAKIRCCGIPIL